MQISIPPQIADVLLTYLPNVTKLINYFYTIIDGSPRNYTVTLLNNELLYIREASGNRSIFYADST